MSDYNRVRDVLIGLEIFLKHGGEAIDASHDEIRSGPAYDAVLTDEELQQLASASWFRETECEGEHCTARFDEDGVEAGEHHPTCNAWMIYV